MIAGEVFDEIMIDEGFEPFIHTGYYCRCLLVCGIARCWGGECSDLFEEQVVTGSYVIACEVFEEMFSDEELWPGMVLITRIFKW